MTDTNVIQEQLEWFNDFVLKYTRIILRIMVSKVGDRMLAEDLLQEVFCKVYKYLDRMWGFEDDHLDFYMRRIISTVIIDYFRKKENELAVDSEIDFNELEIEYNAYSSPENHIIEQDYKNMISSLPEKYSQVLLLHIFYQMTLKDIGVRLGIKEPAVRKRYERAKKKLIDKLKEKS